MWVLGCDQCGRSLPGMSADAPSWPILWAVGLDTGWTGTADGAHRCADCGTPPLAGSAAAAAVVDLRVAGDAIVVQLTGPLLTADTADRLRTLLGQATRYPMILLDLTLVTAVDAAIPAILLRTHQQMRRAGGRLCLVVPSPAVRETLYGLRMEAVFATYDSVATALAARRFDTGGSG